MPPMIIKGGIDGVVVEQDGKCVPVIYSLVGNDLSVSPCNDFEAGSVCTMKVFTKAGKRYRIKMNIAPFLKFDTSHEITITVPAKPLSGFHYSYALYIPDGLNETKDRRLIVNCLNTAPSKTQLLFDDQAALQAANNTVTYLAQVLRTPCLVPAFPRENYRGDDDYVYAQMLNRAAVQKDRIDMQLVSMIKDAQKQLEYNGVHVADKVFVYGFSTDGKFAQRFTLLHPDTVMATIAGAIAGTTTFPITEYKGEKLCYPVGAADIKDLTGADFNKDEYVKVPQLFMMGDADSNDATEWRDCFTKKDAEQIWRLFGRRQVPDRWAATQQILAGVAPGIKCNTYPGVGHTITNEMHNDMVEFFKEHWTR